MKTDIKLYTLPHAGGDGRDIVRALESLRSVVNGISVSVTLKSGDTKSFVMEHAQAQLRLASGYMERNT